jgi:hypothetical protein
MVANIAADHDLTSGLQLAPGAVTAYDRPVRVVPENGAGRPIRKVRLTGYNGPLRSSAQQYFAQPWSLGLTCEA